MLLGTAIGFGCSKNTRPLTNGDIKGVPDFYMGNNLTCTILVSTDADMPDIKKKISLIGLTGPEPKVMFEHKNQSNTFPAKKVFEDAETLAIQIAANPAGGTDTLLLNKKTGVFVRSAMGKGRFDSVFVIAEKGNCK